MAKINVLNMAGQTVGEIELNDTIFAIEPNKSVLHDVVKNYLSNQRQGTQSTLTRAEVRGGGRKPWRQKGTGRARQGSIRSPQWIHGGIALGPKPRDYSYTLNKKVKKLALKSALSAKLAGGELIVIDEIAMSEIKTKKVAEFFTAIEATGKVLVATGVQNDNVIKSARNIYGAKVTNAALINVYDILNSDKLVVDKAAIQKIEEVYA